MGGLRSLVSGHFVTDAEVREALIDGFEDAVDALLDDHVISEEEQLLLERYADATSLSRIELNHNGAVNRVATGAVLRDVAEGIIPQRQDIIEDTQWLLPRWSTSIRDKCP